MLRVIKIPGGWHEVARVISLLDVEVNRENMATVFDAPAIPLFAGRVVAVGDPERGASTLVMLNVTEEQVRILHRMRIA